MLLINNVKDRSAHADCLLYFTGDTWLDQKIDWIEPALTELERNENHKVANLLWNPKDNEAKGESFLEIKDFT